MAETYCGTIVADTLLDIQQKIASRQSLEAKLRELQDQKLEFDRKVTSLRVAFREEQADVEKLEGRSLANYFFQVVGRLDDKLTKERQEAYAARVKLDAAERELAGIQADIDEIYAQLSEVRRAQEQYDALLRQKRSVLAAADTPEGQKLRDTEAKLAALKHYKQEIREAINAGSSARGTADQILRELDSAKNWNTWDTFGGGGIITHVAKHSHLDSAQDLTEELQRKLRRFKTELADVKITADTQVNIDGFLRFADYFFDGLFADWAVGSRISESISSVSATKSKISDTIRKLETMEASTDREIGRLKQELDQIIAESIG